MNDIKPALVFDNVHTGYSPKREIIKGVSTEIHPGEFVGLIGSNGTGKSTLLKSVSGLLPVTQGDIIIQGESSKHLKPKQRAQKIAVVPQSFDIDYDFTVRDIVMMGRNPYQKFNSRETEHDREVVERAMEMTNTTEFADRKFNTLSGGERQRVIIARAIAQETDIILLDEPTSALDMHHQVEVMELIEELNKKGITVLAVLHDLNMASRYCNRLIMLNEGEIVADGTPAEVVTQENLKKLYNMKMLIRNNTLFNKPEVVPIRVIKPKQTDNPKRIHVICGAGSASRLIEELDNKGYEVTTGVVNEGSNDYLVSEALGLEMVSQKPFMPVTIDLQKKNLELMKEADMILIADVPFGDMNIMNLYGIENLNKPVYVHEHALNSDFTNGKLKEALDKIRETSVVEIISDHDDFMDILENPLTDIEEAEIIEEVEAS